DRLSSSERGVVERASIEGQVFHLGTLAALGAAPDLVAPTVRTLTRKQLFRSDQASLPGQDAYRFRHLLIREAAYERVAKEIREGEEEAALEHAVRGAQESEQAGRLAEAARLWAVTWRWEANTLLRCGRARVAAERTLELGRQVGTPWLEVFGAVSSAMSLM